MLRGCDCNHYERRESRFGSFLGPAAHESSTGWLSDDRPIWPIDMASEITGGFFIHAAIVLLCSSRFDASPCQRVVVRVANRRGGELPEHLQRQQLLFLPDGISERLRDWRYGLTARATAVTTAATQPKSPTRTGPVHVATQSSVQSVSTTTFPARRGTASSWTVDPERSI